MSKYTLLVKNTLLVFGGGIGAKLITLLMMPLYTRWLSVDGYGEVDLITVYVSLLLSIVSCCIPEALFVFPAGEDKIKQKQFFSSGLSFNFCTIIIAFLIVYMINIFSAIYGWNNFFTSYSWYIYIIIVSTIIQHQVQQFSRSTGHMVVYSLTGLVYTLSVVGLSFYFVKYHGVVGYIISITLANIISSIYCFVFSKSFEYFRLSSINLNSIKEMLVYSIPLIPNSVMWWLVNAINRPIMEEKLGLYDIGIYAVSNKFPSILAVLFTMFTVSWQISAIDEFNKNSYTEFYNKISKLIFNILLFFLIGIILTSKILVGIFANQDFFEAWKYIPILTFGTFISCISSFVGVNFTAARKSKYFLFSSLYGALASVILNFILIPIFGIWGACLSVVLSFLVVAIARIMFSEKFVKLTNIPYYIVFIAFAIAIIIAYNNEYNFSTALLVLIMLILLLINNKAEIELIKSKLNSKIKNIKS